jgi:hypothetical protein
VKDKHKKPLDPTHPAKVQKNAPSRTSKSLEAVSIYNYPAIERAIANQKSFSINF